MKYIKINSDDPVEIVESLICVFLEENTTDFPLLIVSPEWALKLTNGKEGLHAYSTRSAGIVNVRVSSMCHSIMVVPDNLSVLSFLNFESLRELKRLMNEGK